MAGRFVLTAELNVQAVNIREVARTIRRELKDVVVRVRVEADTRDLDKTRTVLDKTRRSADPAANSMEPFGRNAGLAAKKICRFHHCHRSDTWSSKSNYKRYQRSNRF